MAARTLYELLEHASLDEQDNTISIYDAGNIDKIGKTLTYADLFHIAKANALHLPRLEGVQSDSIILLHFDNHYDNIIWFWSVIAAGYVPAISPPLTHDLE